MHLLIAGDSFGLFDTPLYPTSDQTSEPEGYFKQGISFGELIAKKLDIDISCSAWGGIDINHSVMRALYYILHSKIPVTHVIINLPEHKRLNYRDMSYIDDNILEEFLARENVMERNLDSGDAFFKNIENFDLQVLAETTINGYDSIVYDRRTLIADHFSQLSTIYVLDQYCKNNNINLMVTSIGTGGHLPYLRNQEFLNYEHLIVVDKPAMYNAVDRNIDWLLRPQNHLFPDEHKKFANALLSAYPDFF